MGIYSNYDGKNLAKDNPSEKFNKLVGTFRDRKTPALYNMLNKNVSQKETEKARADDLTHTANKEQVRQNIRTAGHSARTQATVAALGARSTAKINEMNAAGKNRVALEREKGRQQRSVLKAKGALEEKKAATKAAAAAPKPKATASKPRAPRKPAGPLIHTDTKGKITGYTHRSSATLPKPVSPSQATANVAKKRQTKPTA